MEIRYSCNQKDFKRYTTEEMRDEMLITGLYKADEVVAVYSHVDRMVTLGCMPVHETVSIDKGIDVWANFGTHYFLERREIGIFNIGKDSTGIVVADGVKYELGYKDCLYITQGTKEVTFASADPEHPAKFYMVSAPAHCSYETRLIKMADANHRPLGSVETCNKRTINQFIHPDVLKTCQLSMGMTELEPGSNWNTMPSHTHERRMEIYTYFELPEGQVVFHMCGEPTQTRHIVMHNEDAVISPSWSIHSGVGTSNYTFIWAMDGKNGTTDASGIYDGYEQLEELGRGLAKIRPTNYAQYELWKDCGDDMRHNSNNWYDKSRIKYNLPASKGGSAAYFGQPVNPAYCTDTMRCYFSFPIVKVLIDKDDPNAGGKVPVGGFTDQYIFRLAETYLNRAEAYWWLGKNDLATEDEIGRAHV